MCCLTLAFGHLATAGFFVEIPKSSGCVRFAQIRFVPWTPKDGVGSLATSTVSVSVSGLPASLLRFNVVKLIARGDCPE